MKRSLLVLAALLIPTFGAVAAHADSIVATETTTATGSLDGIGFTNALVTLTLTGSTTNVSSLGGVFELPVLQRYPSWGMVLTRLRRTDRTLEVISRNLCRALIPLTRM